jgi:hypothetical protein
MRRDFRDFSARYQRLSTDEKKALIMSSRRKYWDGLVKQFGQRGTDAEEAHTAEVEKRAGVSA